MLKTYRSVRAKIGVPIHDAIHGELTPDGITEGVKSTAEGRPLAWPYVQLLGGKIRLIVCADLERAIRTESVQDVAKAWGVSRSKVSRWRRAMGVGRITPGTRIALAYSSSCRKDRQNRS